MSTVAVSMRCYLSEKNIKKSCFASTVFHDVNKLIPNLDFVNLMAFDYYTPARNPKQADYTAPLHELIDRRFDENANHLVQYW